MYCKQVEYEERLELVYHLFDLDSGGGIDRRELSIFISAALYGLCKTVGIPAPSKVVISKFISDQFAIVDADGNGMIDFEEFEDWISGSAEIQDFILRYTGVQTIGRARRVYEEECKKWSDMFN